MIFDRFMAYVKLIFEFADFYKIGKWVWELKQNEKCFGHSFFAHQYSMYIYSRYFHLCADLVFIKGGNTAKTLCVQELLSQDGRLTSSDIHAF